MKINQMNVLLTGACGGIGRAIATELTKSGANLYLTGRDERALNDLRGELLTHAAPDQQIRIDVVDLTVDTELNQMVARLGQLPNPVNTLINNAGMTSFDLFENVAAEKIDQVIYLNSIVTMKLTHLLLPSFKTLPEARIVNVASTFAAIGFPGYSIYSASKFAVRGFSEALSRELADSHVSVGCFMPRATQTNINSSQVVALNEKLKVAMDKPEVVAKALAQFLSSRQKTRTIGWPEKFFVRLNSIFPSLVSNAIEKKLPIIKETLIKS